MNWQSPAGIEGYRLRTKENTTQTTTKLEKQYKTSEGRRHLPWRCQTINDRKKLSEVLQNIQVLKLLIQNNYGP